MMSSYRTRNVMVAMLLVAGCLTTEVLAQTTAREQAAKLRAQLTEVQTKQEEQQARLHQLEDALKPENIEHSLTGVGTTHPEELREQRRLQLEKEKTGVQTQLDQLALSRTRLEAAVAAADGRAYQESARVPENAAKGPQVAPVEASTTAIAQPHTSIKQTPLPIKKSRRRHARRLPRRIPASAVANH